MEKQNSFKKAMQVFLEITIIMEIHAPLWQRLLLCSITSEKKKGRDLRDTLKRLLFYDS